MAHAAGRSGDDHGTELDRLRSRYPQWRIWRGRVTGDYWAMPPPGHPTVRELISSGDLGELARRLAEAEEWRGLLELDGPYARADKAVHDAPARAGEYPVAGRPARGSSLAVVTGREGGGGGA